MTEAQARAVLEAAECDLEEWPPDFPFVALHRTGRIIRGHGADLVACAEACRAHHRLLAQVRRAEANGDPGREAVAAECERLRDAVERAAG